MKLCLSIFFELVFTIGFSQQVDYSKFRGDVIDATLTVRLSNPSFFSYSSKFNDLRFLPINVASQIQIGSCEEIVLMYYKSQATSDLAKLTKSGSSEGYGVFSYNKSDTIKNYIRLNHKLTFDYGGLETAIVKYHEFRDSTEVDFNVIQLQKTHKGWKLTKIKELNDISYVIRFLHTSAFWEFYNQSDSKYKIINELRKQVRNESGIVDVLKLSKVIKSNKDKLKEFGDIN